MSIEDKLKQLEKSPAFQKKVLDARKIAFQSGKPFGQGGVSGAGGVAFSQQSAKAEVYDILMEIRSTINARFPGMSQVLFDISGPFMTQDGFYEYRIQFNANAVHRDSLYEDGYPDGLENVVALYSHGSKASQGYVCGVWMRSARGAYTINPHVYIPKGYQTQPESFLRDKIDALNEELASKNISIKLDKKYYP